MAKAKYEFNELLEAMMAGNGAKGSAAVEPERMCEAQGCEVDISDRDPSARFCIPHVRVRLEDIVLEERIARNQSA